MKRLNHKSLSLSHSIGYLSMSLMIRNCVQVASEMDSECIGLWPQGLETPRCRYERHILERTVRQAGKE
jgi:predicted glycosyl hydrolase (DUF1957 family)